MLGHRVQEEDQIEFIQGLHLLKLHCGFCTTNLLIKIVACHVPSKCSGLCLWARARGLVGCKVCAFRQKVNGGVPPWLVLVNPMGAVIIPQQKTTHE